MSTPKVARNNNESDDPVDLKNFKKFIKEVKRDSPYFTRKSKEKSKNNEILKASGGNFKCGKSKEKSKNNEKEILKVSGGNFKWIKY